MEEPGGGPPEAETASMREHGLMVYPERGWRWLFFSAPLWLWRMGAAPLMRFRFCVVSCWGRRSGEPRHTMLEWVEDGGKVHFAAGWGPRSQWVRNLLANPHVTVDSGLGTIRGRAVRVVDGDLMRRIYPHMKKSPTWMQYTAAWGVDGADVEDVAAKADRLWTFVVEPDDERGEPHDERVEPDDAKGAVHPPRMEPDLFWIPAMILLGIGVALLGWWGRRP